MPDHNTSQHGRLDGAAGSTQENAQYTQSAGAAQDGPAPKTPSLVDRIKARLKPEIPIFILMFKGGLAPTIAIAFFQSDAVSAEYTTLGYLVAIMSLLGFAIMPRAKFVQTMILDILAVCVGACMALLGLWTSIQARKHTTPPGHPIAGYNPSASAVNGIWLFFNIFLVNALRSAYPQFNFPTIIYAIFANVAFVYGAVFSSEAQVLSFVQRLITAFLTGFALSTAVSFLVFPTNARKPVFGEMTGLLNSMKGLVKAQLNYMRGFEHANPYAPHAPPKPQKQSFLSKLFGSKKKQDETKATPPHFLQDETAALKASLGGMIALFTKLYADLPFAKREFCIGKLSAEDLQELHHLLREVAHPLLGLGGIVEIFERVSKIQAWDHMFSDDGPDSFPVTEEDANRRTKESFEEWREIMRTLTGSFGRTAEAMEEALEHVLFRLEFQKRPNAKADVESKSDHPAPGEAAFTAYFETRLESLLASKHDTIKSWCNNRGIPFPPAPDSKAEVWTQQEQEVNAIPDQNERRRRELFLVLYMEHLFYSAAKAMLTFVKFADAKVEDGTMKKNRLISPGLKRLKKWGVSMFSQDKSQGDVDTSGDPLANKEVYFGQALSGIRKDPEHLPAQGFWEHVGNGVRTFPRLLRSEHTVFGFRAACATMSVAIIAYLRASQTFFIQERLVWAMIMVAFSMMRTSGHSVFNFLGRIAGTAIAMVASYVIWYIVDGKTAGVIVFLWVWITLCFYPLLKNPQLIIIAILSCVTAILIVGYEVQTDKIGVAVSESNGQKAYPVYILAPYRLATVCGGLFVAYIWTIFPYPITEQSEVRRTTGAVLYSAAAYYSMVHEMFLTRLHCTATYLGSKGDKDTPAARLEKARSGLYSRAQLIIQQLKEAEAYTRWEINMGGRFPQDKYVEITKRVERIVNCTSLISYASRSFLEHETVSAESQVWKQDFRRLVSSISPTSEMITSRLAMLSSSLTNAQPLPPYVGRLKPLQLVDRLAKIDTEALSLKHLEEPGYSAFAVCQITARTIVIDLNETTELVRDLVGELDFSFNVVDRGARTAEWSSSDESGGSSSSKMSSKED